MASMNFGPTAGYPPKKACRLAALFITVSRPPPNADPLAELPNWKLGFICRFGLDQRFALHVIDHHYGVHENQFGHRQPNFSSKPAKNTSEKKSRAAASLSQR